MLESIKVPFEECKEELMKSTFICFFFFWGGGVVYFVKDEWTDGNVRH